MVIHNNPRDNNISRQPAPTGAPQPALGPVAVLDFRRYAVELLGQGPQLGSDLLDDLQRPDVALPLGETPALGETPWGKPFKKAPRGSLGQERVRNL